MSASLDDLHPAWQPVARAIVAATNAAYTDGSTLRPGDTFRTVSEQATKVAAGLSKVRLGWHQFGMAFDGCVFGPDGVYITNGADERYATFGRIAEQHGCIWGGAWHSFPDPSHVEWHPGFTLGQYLGWIDSHRVSG